MLFLKRIIVIFTVLVLSLIVFLGYFFYEKREEQNENIGSLTLRDRYGTVIANKGLSDGYIKPYRGSLENNFVRALIEVEDTRYWQHSGVDVLAKFASIKSNFKAGKVVRGGSTLTEQYIKNRYYKGEDRTVIQKGKEALFATFLSLTESKEETLRNYLDTLYFGNRIFGIQTAIELYYGKNKLETLTEDEILELLVRVRTPNITRENLSENEKYKEFLSKKLAYTSSKALEIKTPTNYYTNRFPLLSERIEKEITLFCQNKENALQKFTIDIPKSLCQNQNKELTLSIDAGLMQYSQDVLHSTLETLSKEHVSAGGVYIKNPKEGKILVYISTNSRLSEDANSIDMVTRERSVGSILKPFIYLLALEKGAEIDDFILDDDTPYPTGIDGKSFIPKNYSEKSFGPVRLKEALGSSLNSSSVRLVEYLGLSEVYNSLKSYGLNLTHDVGYYGYGIALGTVELSLENVVEAYGRLGEMNTNTWLLQKVLSDKQNRALSFGVSSILGTSIPLAVKTGTSTDFRDNWTVSYTDTAIIGVWVGNPDGESMQDVSGVSGAGPVWKKLAEHLITTGLIREKAENIPPGVHETYFCFDTSCLRREKSWTKSEKKQTSFPKDHIFSEKDFLGNISEAEKIKWNIRTE